MSLQITLGTGGVLKKRARMKAIEFQSSSIHPVMEHSDWSELTGVIIVTKTRTTDHNKSVENRHNPQQGYTYTP